MSQISRRGAASSRGFDVVVSAPRYEGYVVVDSIVDGRSAGGVRAAADLDLDEVRLLAAEMSLKYALFDLPRGGAKAGLRLDPRLDPDERLAAFEDFGRRLAPIVRNGIYSPGMDMNCGPDELRALYRGAGFELGPLTDTSLFTALSVHHALLAVIDRLPPSRRPWRLAIEGFGSVARHLAERLDPERFRVVAVSTVVGACTRAEGWVPAQLAAAKSEFGDALVGEVEGDRIGRENLFEVEADVLLPSSRTGVLSADAAAALPVRAVVPISNAPYREGAVACLHARSIPALPGYLSNVGGVLASSLFDQGLPRPEIEALFAEHYRPVVDAVLERADRQGKAVVEVVEALARARMRERPAFRDRSLAQRVGDRFVRPRLPRSLRARSARTAFLEAARGLLARLRTEGEAP